MFDRTKERDSQIVIRVYKEEKEKLKELCRSKGLEMSSFIREAISTKIENMEN